jgi:glycosyltransferase involved in cell wall biosynthesis
MFVLQVAVVKGRGGIATAVAHYERMFRAMGVSSAVVFRGPSADALRGEGVDVIDAQVLRRAGGQPILALVHSDLALGALKRLFPNALFATPCHSDKFKRKRGADLIITLNGAQTELAQAALPGARIARLGNPYVAQAALAPTSDGSPRLNFVARFIPTKDPETLLKAMAFVERDVTVRFIGEGELESKLRYVAEGLAVDADFAGWLSAPFEHFHRNDVLVLPSTWEGLPYLLQEALDHGVPIIAADNAGNRAALADGAYGALFPIGDPVALGDAIEAALADLDALRARAEKGRAALHARYGAEAFWRALNAELDQTPRRRDGRHA